jgi:hypothetical protein
MRHIGKVKCFTGVDVIVLTIKHRVYGYTYIVFSKIHFIRPCLHRNNFLSDGE